MVNPITYVGLSLRDQKRAARIRNAGYTLSDCVERLAVHTTKKGLNPDKFFNKHRTRERVYVMNRQASMFWLHKIKEFNSTESGAKFSLDHATVLHACKNVQDALDGYNPELKEVYDDLINNI